MLKACWDCVAGSGVLRNGGENEGSYGVQMNGNSPRAPLQPAQPTGRNMFVLPRALSNGDKVLVSGTFVNTDCFTANLLTGSPSPDYNNIACQLEAKYPTSTNSENRITLRIIERGQSEIIHEATGMMPGPSFKLEFHFELFDEDTPILTVYVMDSVIQQFGLKHNIDTITFLDLSGNIKVTALSFEFA